MFAEELDRFLKAENAVAIVKKSYRDGMLLHGTGYAYGVRNTPSLPAAELAAEDYRRLARLAKSGSAPTLSINSNVKFHDEDTKAYNIIAEVPGTDPKAGYIMADGHFDSRAAGDGAGSVMIMEAARILSRLGVRPKRTTRLALWGAEEQGLLGSLAYVERHLAKRPRKPNASGQELITK